jgi:hypothetical protein
MHSQIKDIQSSLEKSESQKAYCLEKSIELDLKIQQLSNYTNNIENTSMINSEIVDFHKFIQDTVSKCQELLISSKIEVRINNIIGKDPIKIRKDLVSIIFIELLLLSMSHHAKQKQEIVLSVENKNNWLKISFENSSYQLGETINKDSISIVNHISSLLNGKIEMDILEDSGSLFLLSIPTSATETKKVFSRVENLPNFHKVDFFHIIGSNNKY